MQEIRAAVLDAFSSNRGRPAGWLPALFPDLAHPEGAAWARDVLCRLCGAVGRDLVVADNFCKESLERVSQNPELLPQLKGRLEPCGHVFCERCVRGHLEGQRRRGVQETACPAPGCDMSLAEDQLAPEDFLRGRAQQLAVRCPSQCLPELLKALGDSVRASGEDNHEAEESEEKRDDEDSNGDDDDNDGSVYPRQDNPGAVAILGSSAETLRRRLIQDELGFLLQRLMDEGPAAFAKAPSGNDSAPAEEEHPDDVPTECDWDGFLGCDDCGGAADGDSENEEGNADDGSLWEGAALYKHCMHGSCPILSRLRLSRVLPEFLRLMTANTTNAGTASESAAADGDDANAGVDVDASQETDDSGLQENGDDADEDAAGDDNACQPSEMANSSPNSSAAQPEPPSSPPTASASASSSATIPSSPGNAVSEPSAQQRTTAGTGGWPRGAAAVSLEPTGVDGGDNNAYPDENKERPDAAVSAPQPSASSSSASSSSASPPASSVPQHSSTGSAASLQQPLQQPQQQVPSSQQQQPKVLYMRPGSSTIVEAPQSGSSYSSEASSSSPSSPSLASPASSAVIPGLSEMAACPLAEAAGCAFRTADPHSMASHCSDPMVHLKLLVAQVQALQVRLAAQEAQNERQEAQLAEFRAELDSIKGRGAALQDERALLELRNRQTVVCASCRAVGPRAELLGQVCVHHPRPAEQGKPSVSRCNRGFRCEARFGQCFPHPCCGLCDACSPGCVQAPHTLPEA